MHIGHNNMQSNYNMSNQELPTTDQQRDLRIIITKDLKWQKQTGKSCKTANRVLEFITRHFRYKSKELILLLYKSLVRPHLEHAVQFWSPHLGSDIDKLEKKQRRATKMIPEIRNHSCHQDLDLISLVQRRLRGQLIEVFKYLNRFTTASARGLFEYDLNDRTRNNGAKLIVQHFNTSVAQHFYPIKITTIWNALPSEVVSSRTVNSFKNSLDKHWEENLPNVRVNCLQSSKFTRRSVLLLLLLLNYNYGPISITSVLSKVLERLLLVRLLRFM